MTHKTKPRMQQLLGGSRPCEGAKYRHSLWWTETDVQFDTPLLSFTPQTTTHATHAPALSSAATFSGRELSQRSGKHQVRALSPLYPPTSLPFLSHQRICDLFCEFWHFCSTDVNINFLPAGGRVAAATAAPLGSTRPVDDTQCLICLDASADTVLYRCGHLCLCYACGMQLQTRGACACCPVCRAPIQDIMRVYKAGHLRE